MGRKGSWFSSVKKALSSSDSKGGKAERANKSKKNWFGKESLSISDALNPEPVEVSHPHPLPPLEEEKLTEVEKHAYSVAVAEAAEAATEAASEVVGLTTLTQLTGKPKEEAAAIKIQTVFRGYLARRALQALRGLVRLKSLVDGPITKRQTANALKCMQTLSHVHSQIQLRRIGMLEENRALQRQLLQKCSKELESLRMGEEWDDTLQSKEQIETGLLHKYEAAMRRERALAYSYTHQQTWKKSAKSNNLLFMDPTDPHWGWSWLERWTSPGPLNSQTTAEKDLNFSRSSLKRPTPGTAAGEITKSFARHQLNSGNSSPPATQKPSSGQQSPETPLKAVSSPAVQKLNRKGTATSQDDDSMSVLSIQSDRNRRHTIAGSSIRDDESLASSPSIPSYMTPTRSAKAKSKSPSPLGMENGGTPDKESAGHAKKRLSFPPSPARARRHSGPPKVPPKVEASSIVDNNVNGGSVH